MKKIDYYDEQTFQKTEIEVDEDLYNLAVTTKMMHKNCTSVVTNKDGDKLSFGTIQNGRSYVIRVEELKDPMITAIQQSTTNNNQLNDFDFDNFKI